MVEFPDVKHMDTEAYWLHSEIFSHEKERNPLSVSTYMDLEDILLSKIKSQRQRAW